MQSFVLLSSKEPWRGDLSLGFRYGERWKIDGPEQVFVFSPSPILAASSGVESRQNKKLFFSLVSLVPEVREMLIKSYGAIRHRLRPRWSRASISLGLGWRGGGGGFVEPAKL